MIIVTAKELTEEDRKRLNGMVEEVFEKSADTCDDLLQLALGLVFLLVEPVQFIVGYGFGILDLDLIRESL